MVSVISRVQVVDRLREPPREAPHRARERARQKRRQVAFAAGVPLAASRVAFRQPTPRLRRPLSLPGPFLMLAGLRGARWRPVGVFGKDKGRRIQCRWRAIQILEYQFESLTIIMPATLVSNSHHVQPTAYPPPLASTFYRFIAASWLLPVLPTMLHLPSPTRPVIPRPPDSPTH